MRMVHLVVLVLLAGIAGIYALHDTQKQVYALKKQVEKEGEVRENQQQMCLNLLGHYKGRLEAVEHKLANK